MYDTRDLKLLQETMVRYNVLINRPYLDHLSCFSTVPLTSCTLPIYLLQLSAFPSTTSPQNFEYILNALNGLNVAIGYLICSNPEGYTVYIGIQGNSCSSLSTELLITGIKQAFPTLTITPIEEPHVFLSQLFNTIIYPFLSVTACIPAASSSGSLMKDFTELMGTEQPYLVFFLATPCCHQALQRYIDELYEIYSILSMFSQSTQNASEGLANNTSTTTTNSKNEINGSSTTKTSGSNSSYNEGQYTNLSGSTPISYCSDNALNVTLLQNSAQANNTGQSDSCARGHSNSHSHTHSKAHLTAINKTFTHGLNFTIQNKWVKDALSQLDTQIARLQTLMDQSAFSFNAYFLSPSSATSLRAAYNFSGLCQSASTENAVTAVNFWSNSHPDFPELLSALGQFEAPVFCDQSQIVHTGTLIQSSELVNCFYLSS